MRALKLSLLIMVLGGISKLWADDDSTQPSLVNAPVTNVYTPSGFDDNDNAQVVVEGEFQNTCYKVGPVRLKVDREEQKIQFQLMALKYSGPCLEVRTPFIKVVDLGILPEGKYSVSSVGKASRPAALSIHHTESKMADDFLYAPVDSGFVRKNDAGDRRILTLTGAFPNSCMKFSEEENTVLVKRVGNILEVLPIVQMQKGNCLTVMVPFTKSVFLSDEIPTGKYLVHIRTLNGQSYNKVDFIGSDPVVENQ